MTQAAVARQGLRPPFSPSSPVAACVERCTEIATCPKGQAVAAIATATTEWTVGGATMMVAVARSTTQTATAADRTPETGSQTAASTTTATAATAAAGLGDHAPAPSMTAAARLGRRVGASSRRATARRISSTSRALRRWPCATQVHGATSLHDDTTSPRVDATSPGSGVTTASLSNGMTSPRVRATSDGMTSPRVTAARSHHDSITSPRIMDSATLSTTPGGPPRNASFPTPRPAQHRRGVRACHPRKSSSVRGQRPRSSSMGVCSVDRSRRRAAPTRCFASPQHTVQA